MTGVVTPGPGQATASPSNVAVPGPRTNSSRPKALVCPREFRTVRSTVWRPGCAYVWWTTWPLAGVPSPKFQVRSMSSLPCEASVKVRSAPALTGSSGVSPWASVKPAAGAVNTGAGVGPGGGVGPGTTGSEAPPHAFLRREIALRRRLIAGRPLRSGRSLRASLVSAAQSSVTRGSRSVARSPRGAVRTITRARLRASPANTKSVRLRPWMTAARRVLPLTPSRRLKLTRSRPLSGARSVTRTSAPAEVVIASTLRISRSRGTAPLAAAGARSGRTRRRARARRPCMPGRPSSIQCYGVKRATRPATLTRPNETR